jgi:tetraacyldisaccharide 4'-kinase
MKLLRKLAYPLSLLYGAVVFLRNKAYDRGWLASREFEVPVLCIGNLSVGGSGKTPMVEWVLRELLPKRRIAVLSRGYKRKSKGFRLVEPGSTPEMSGDEPLQIARKFPGAVVAVDANRQRGIEILVAREHPDLIILDDGFQHRKVRPLRSVLLTAYGELYPVEPYLPAGNLRDHRSQADRADLVVVTKCPPGLPEAERGRIRELLQLQPGQSLAFASLGYGDPIGPDGKTTGWEAFGKTPFTLVTGIARPEPLVGYLEGMGLSFEHLRFADHHAFTPGEVRNLRAKGRLLTTEKDAVRLGDGIGDLWVLPVRHAFSPGDREVMQGFLSQF